MSAAVAVKSVLLKLSKAFPPRNIWAFNKVDWIKASAKWLSYIDITFSHKLTKLNVCDLAQNRQHKLMLTQNLKKMHHTLS